jgi:hypothetical protein
VSVVRANIHLSVRLAVVNLEFLVGLLAIPTRSLLAKTCCDGFFALLSPGVLIAAAAELEN